MTLDDVARLAERRRHARAELNRASDELAGVCVAEYLAGTPTSVICYKAGIPRSTLSRWVADATG